MANLEVQYLAGGHILTPGVKVVVNFRGGHSLPAVIVEDADALPGLRLFAQYDDGRASRLFELAGRADISVV